MSLSEKNLRKKFYIISSTPTIFSGWRDHLKGSTSTCLFIPILVLNKQILKGDILDNRTFYYNLNKMSWFHVHPSGGPICSLIILKVRELLTWTFSKRLYIGWKLKLDALIPHRTLLSNVLKTVYFVLSMVRPLWHGLGSNFNILLNFITLYDLNLFKMKEYDLKFDFVLDSLFYFF